MNQFEKAIKDGIWFDGSSVEGFGRICESDMYLKPDLNTFAIVPWKDDLTARFICNLYGPDHNPFELDPRFILKKELEKIRKKGLNFMVGAELEFYIFKKNGTEISVLPHDEVGYFDLGGDLAIKIRNEMMEKIAEFNINVEAGHHEVGNSQHEIDLVYNDALTIADSIVTSKIVIKRVAEEHSLYATFVPKPIFGMPGNGMHIHQSIFKNGRNIFSNPEDKYGLSDFAYHYLAGILSHIKEISAVISPIVNSYKRLISGFEAPVYICWGQMNRSALVRIPRINKGKYKSTRLELRSPDPTANPYLAFAAILKSGMDGVEKKMKPPEPVEENIFKLKRAEIEEKDIKILPRSLYEALTEYLRSKILKELFGEVLFQKYFDIKMKEWEEYSMHVSKWEIDKYLDLY